VLPDAAAAERARAGYRDAYEAKGWGAGMVAFIAMTSWQGEFTDEYFAQPMADPSELLGQQATVFPSHHGGFLGGEFGYTGQPEPFARKLREVLDDDN
jgi:hypothetical protein